MKKNSLFILVIFGLTNLKSQTISDINQNYKIGISYLQQNNLILADSFLAKCVKHENFTAYLANVKNTIPINDIHYNYAIVKLGLKDTCSFCQEIHSASTYNDTDAFNFYRKICIKLIDSSFYDKSYKSCNKEKSRYIKIEYYDRYRNKKYGRILDIKKREDNESKIKVVDFGNIIGLFRIDGTDTIFYRLIGNNFLPKFTKWNKDYYSYIDSKIKYPEAKNIARAKYQCYNLNVNYKVLIDETGKVIRIELKDAYPENLGKIYLDEALILVNQASGYITQGNILGKDVKLELIFPINFNLQE